MPRARNHHAGPLFHVPAIRTFMSFSVHDHSSHRSQDQTYRQFFLPPRDSFRASFESLDLEELTSDFHASFNNRSDYVGKCMHARAAYSRLDTVTAIDVGIFVDT